jgi:hypothetical protein
MEDTTMLTVGIPGILTIGGRLWAFVIAWQIFSSLIGWLLIRPYAQRKRAECVEVSLKAVRVPVGICSSIITPLTQGIDNQRTTQRAHSTVAVTSLGLLVTSSLLVAKEAPSMHVGVVVVATFVVSVVSGLWGYAHHEVSKNIAIQTGLLQLCLGGGLTDYDARKLAIAVRPDGDDRWRVVTFMAPALLATVLTCLGVECVAGEVRATGELKRSIEKLQVPDCRLSSIGRDEPKACERFKAASEPLPAGDLE